MQSNIFDHQFYSFVKKSWKSVMNLDMEAKVHQLRRTIIQSIEPHSRILLESMRQMCV